MLPILPTRILHNPHAATRHKHGRTTSQHRGGRNVCCSDRLFYVPMPYYLLHTTKPTAGQWGGECKMYAGVCKIL